MTIAIEPLYRCGRVDGHPTEAVVDGYRVVRTWQHSGMTIFETLACCKTIRGARWRAFFERLLHG